MQGGVGRTGATGHEGVVGDDDNDGEGATAGTEEEEGATGE